MSEIPTKTYPPAFVQAIIDEAQTQHNETLLLMSIGANGLHVNPDIPVDECAQRVLEALRPLIQHTIDAEVERRLAERGTR